MSECAAAGIVKASSVLIVVLVESGARHVDCWCLVVMAAIAEPTGSLARPMRQKRVYLARLWLEVEYFGSDEAAAC